MTFNEAMQMLGSKLQGKYGHLGFKYKKSDKTLTRHSKNFTYMIAFSSFGGNTKESISIEVCYIINTRPYDPYGYSFLAEEKPEYERYFTSWGQVTPVSFPNPMQNRIIENYCSGVYLSPDQVMQLLKDMEQDPKVCEDLERIWSNGQIAVLKKALSAAAELGAGLLEATEVVEPNPISPNESTSYSNLYHCDRDGVYLYIDTVSAQLADVIGRSEEQA